MYILILSFLRKLGTEREQSKWSKRERMESERAKKKERERVVHLSY